MRAEIGEHVGVQRDEAPVGVHGKDSAVDGGAGGQRGDQAVGGLLGPADGSTGPDRRQADERLVRVQVLLGAEPASGLPADHPHPVVPQAEQVGGVIAHVVRCLGGRPDRQCLLGIRRDDRAGLQRVRRSPPEPEGHVDDVCRVVGRRGTVAARVTDLEVRGHVGPPVGVQPRRVRIHRVLDTDRRRQFVVVHGDEVGGVAGRGRGTRHHDRERLTDVADHVVQQRVGQFALSRPRRHARQPQIRRVAHADDVHHPVGGAGGRQVVARHPGVRHRAADHVRVNHVRQPQTAHEPTAPGEQPRVLTARHRASDIGVAHWFGHRLSMRRRDGASPE
ncbi:hypothetical protein GCM10009558_012650 [Virgisporangium aurantiacum]